ncbi:hypothetical protein G6F40_016201 [Rhizopus arrhizus]|nr:hypothetical protein G6F40_016201 [Rhizopus arrhizus]
MNWAGYLAGSFSSLGVDGLGEARRIAVVKIHLVLAGDLLERRHRRIHLVRRVFRHIAQLASLHAALVVDDLHVVGNARMDALPGEGEHPAQRDRPAQHQIVRRLRHGRRQSRRQAQRGQQPR